MSQEPLYSIRDVQGNVYGPANGATLQQWAREGRVVPGMFVSDHLGNWVEASSHPLLFQMFRNGTGADSTTVSATRVPGSGGVEPSYIGGSEIPRVNALGLLSFVFAVVSYPLACCLCVPFLTATTSIALGLASLYQFKNHPQRYRGKWMAVAGIVISLFIFLFLLIAYVIGLIQAPTPHIK